jgi:hypothetical protein
MADHPHTIDRWDDATGENLIEQIAGVTDCQNNDMADAEAITPQTHQWTPRPLRPAIRAPTIGCPKEKARPNLGGTAGTSHGSSSFTRPLRLPSCVSLMREGRRKPRSAPAGRHQQLDRGQGLHH